MSISGVGRPGRARLIGLAISPPLTHSASISQRRRLIEPLEARGAVVDVIFTVPACAQGAPFGELLRALLAEYLQPWHVVRSASVPVARDVAEAWRRGYSLLLTHMRATGVMYDYVLSTRHDLEFMRNVTTWPANLSKLAFHGEVRLDCAESGVGGTWQAAEIVDPSACRLKTNDKVLWVPGAHLGAVVRALGAVAGGERSHRREGFDVSLGVVDVNPHYLIEHFAKLIETKRIPHGLTPAPVIASASGRHARDGVPSARAALPTNSGRRRALLHAHVVPPMGTSCEPYEAARARGFFLRCAPGLAWASTIGEHAIGALWREVDSWAWEQPWYRYAPRREPDVARQR